MHIHSFSEKNKSLTPFELEIAMLRGLPRITYVGLPDQNIKESAYRIEAAIKSAGFQFPKGHQVLVNLKSNTAKQVSRGLEFAVAVGILKLTEQISLEIKPNSFFYGELGLDGSVRFPQSEKQIELNEKQWLFLGQGSPRIAADKIEIQHLKDLKSSFFDVQIFEKPKLIRPPTDGVTIREGALGVLKLLSFSGLHGLLAGPAGSGKTFMAELIWKLREEPAQFENLSMDWLPLMRPHHTSSAQGLIGGGSGKAINLGEFFNANTGVLILDELFEFKPKVIESLREPLETGEIQIARSAGSIRSHFQVQVLATTNLCPCGDYVPGQPVRCSMSLNRCRSYSTRFSGPLIDRFSIMDFSNQWRKGPLVEVKRVLDELEHHRNFLQKNRLDTLAFRETRYFQSFKFSHAISSLIDGYCPSERRRMALIKVACAFAEMQGRLQPNSEDFDRSLEYSIKPFLKIKKWD